MNSKIITAREAANLIKDGDSVVVGGFVGSGHPEALTAAVEERFIEEQHPPGPKTCVRGRPGGFQGSRPESFSASREW